MVHLRRGEAQELRPAAAVRALEARHITCKTKPKLGLERFAVPRLRRATAVPVLLPDPPAIPGGPYRSSRAALTRALGELGLGELRDHQRSPSLGNDRLEDIYGIRRRCCKNKLSPPRRSNTPSMLPTEGWLLE